MFRGNAQHSLDAKGRMVVPAKFRDELGVHFVITKGIGNCLFAFTANDFAVFEQKMKTMPLSDPEIRRFQRYFFGSASDCEQDSIGRVVLPQDLREHAGIVRDIVTLGLPGRLEIWSKENWERYNEESNFVDDELAKKMTELGI